MSFWFIPFENGYNKSKVRLRLAPRFPQILRAKWESSASMDKSPFPRCTRWNRPLPTKAHDHNTIVSSFRCHKTICHLCDKRFNMSTVLKFIQQRRNSVPMTMTTLLQLKCGTHRVLPITCGLSKCVLPNPHMNWGGGGEERLGTGRPGYLEQIWIPPDWHYYFMWKAQIPLICHLKHWTRSHWPIIPASSYTLGAFTLCLEANCHD